MQEMEIEDLMEFIETKSNTWKLANGESVDEYFIWEKILESICEYVYRNDGGNDELIHNGILSEREVTEHLEYILKEFLKNDQWIRYQTAVSDTKIHIKDFEEHFQSFRRFFREHEQQGVHGQQLKLLFSADDCLYGGEKKNHKYENSENSFFANKVKRFLNKFLPNENFISKDIEGFYMVLLSVYLYGDDCANKEMEEYRKSLLSYRKGSNKPEMMDVLSWCIKCCGEIYANDFIMDTCPFLFFSLKGINSFLKQFKFYQNKIKLTLLSMLINTFNDINKRLPLDDSFTFIEEFRIVSVYTEKPFIGDWRHEKDRYMGDGPSPSGDYRYIRRYLKEYFGKEFEEDISDIYFSYKMEREDYSASFNDDEISFWENIDYNHFLAYVFVLLDLPSDNFISIAEFERLWYLYLNGMEEINIALEKYSGDDKSSIERRGEITNYAVNILLYDINESSKRGPEYMKRLCYMVFKYLQEILIMKKIKLSSDFVNRCLEISNGKTSKVRYLFRKEEESIYWEEEIAFDEILTAVCFKKFLKNEY